MKTSFFVLIAGILFSFNAIAQPDLKKLYDNRYLFTKGKKVGIKDAKGKVILAAKFDEIELIETDYYQSYPVFSASLDTKRGLYHFTGKLLLEHKYDAIGREQNFLILRLGDYTGACDTSGKILLEPGKYEKVNFLRNSNHWLVTDKDGKRAIINRQGVELTEFNIANIAPYPSAKQYSCFLFETYDNKVGLIGLWQDLGIFYSRYIPAVFTSIENFEFEGPPGTSFSALLLGDGSNLFWYSTLSDTIVADSLEDVYPCMQYQGLQNHRVVLMKRNGKTALVGAGEGEIIIPYILDDAYPVVDMYMMAGKDKRYGFIDLNLFLDQTELDPEEILNQQVFPFDFVMEISSSVHSTDIRFIAGTERSYYLLNYRGDTLVQQKFEFVSFDDCLEYFILAEQNKLKGIYNIRANNVIPVKYDDIEPIYIDETVYFIVTAGKKKGLYNAEGKLLLEEKYSEIKLLVKDNILF
ncbi:MAG: hypothetical protein ACHQF2_08705, partial [Flavobacteriales bacterium]